MAKSAYEQVEEGEWYTPSAKHKERCCDCGLTHRSEYRVRGGQIEIRVWRDERATANARRSLRAKLMEIVRRIA